MTARTAEPPFEAYAGPEPFGFVSYAHADAAVVFPVLAALHRDGWRLWYDQGIRIGKEWPEEIGAALRKCAAFLVFVSPNSMKSAVVREEIYDALGHGKEIVAIHLAETELPDGVRLRLGSRQAILRHRISAAEFEDRLRKALPDALLGPAVAAAETGETILGVDFGTRNSLVAALVGGKPTVLLNREGERSTPSVVAVAPSGEWVCGSAAVAVADTEPARAVFSVKTRLGSDFAFDRDGRKRSATDLAALILAKLRADAEISLGKPVRKAVATAPARFTARQNAELHRAFDLAGFEVVRLVPEPTAVVLAYGHSRRNTQVVYDLGGGSFDVSAVEVDEDGIYEVKAVDGDTRLGGDDFDDALADLCLRRFEAEHGVGLGEDLVAWRRVLNEAERAKAVLSVAQSARVFVPFLTFRDGRPLHLDLTVSLADFRTAIDPLIERSLACCRRVLKQSRLAPDRIDGVILAGLATKTPAVRAAVRDLFGREPFCSVDPGEAVALGAAIQGGFLSRKSAADAVLVDVTPFGLSVELADGGAFALVEANATIPLDRRGRFDTTPGATRAVVNVFEGGAATAVEGVFLGSAVLDGLRPDRKDADAVEVMLSLDVNRRPTVLVRDPATGKEAKAELDDRARSAADPARRPKSTLRGETPPSDRP